MYTNETLDTLEEARGRLDAALAECVEAYEKKLARQRANDALCKEFAEAADSFAVWIRFH